MAAVADTSSAPLTNDKPVIVRVKRKAFQHRVDAFWLEINERPLKRALLDFGKLSVSDSSSTRVEGLKTTKVLVHHVETVTSSENTVDVLRSFVPNSSDAREYGGEQKERIHMIKTVNKQDALLVKAKESQEVLSRNARYEQIWRSRKGKRDTQEDEMCRLYDVVKIDVNEQEIEVKQKYTNLENHESMAEYLPLLREVLPTAAVEIENDIHDHMSRQASSDDYVYDFYAVTNDDNVMDADSAIQYPLIQVDDADDYYAGPDNSDYETDDSNAENNPLNDYPDEEESEDDDEATSRSSADEESKDESRTSGSQSQGSENESQASSNEDKNSGSDFLGDHADWLAEQELLDEYFDSYSGDD